MSIKSKSLHAAAILSVLCATTSPSMAASASYGSYPAASSKATPTVPNNPFTLFQDVQNPMGYGSLGRQYASGASVTFSQKTVYYKTTQYEQQQSMQASTLDSLCNCYNQAVSNGTNINQYTGTKMTQEEYYSSEVFQQQSMAYVETLYPSIFPSHRQFVNMEDIFSAPGLVTLIPRMESVLSMWFPRFF